jgi:hypothetical protein
MLGVKWDPDQLKSWWEQNKMTIKTTYNLQSDAGRQQWFSAYRDADEVTRHFLVRLWMLTPETNQVTLVKAATEEKTAAMAKAVITELWEAKHLGNKAIQAMFENFMRVEFVDSAKNFTNRSEYQHNLEIILKFDYPFNIFISYRHPVVIDGKTNFNTTALDGLGLEPKLREYRIGCIGGYVPGQTASMTFEAFQLDHYPDGQELWHVQWNLGPIPLGE